MVICKEKLTEMDNKWKKISFDYNSVKTMDISRFITDEHIDIMIRYLYVKSYIEKNNYERYKKLYEKMQKKRIGKCHIKDFNEIIESFVENGYLKEYPIPINKKEKMLNGSHRLACCLYFNINPYVVVFDEDDHFYDIDWFKNNGFTDEELDEIICTKEELIKKYHKRDVDFENAYTAMITPLLDNGELDINFFKNHANKMFENGIKGLFVCGNTGNGINTNLNVKKRILRESLSLKKFSIICHIGCETDEETFEFAEYTNNTNVLCVASMPPYKHINNSNDIKEFYKKLALLSKKPVLIYHIPSVTGIDLSANELIELLNIKNVIGIKYTDDNIEKLKSISLLEKEKYIFFGRDDYLLDGMNNGATGGIGGCYNLFPSFIYNIINKYRPKDNQRKLNYCIKKLRGLYPTMPGSQFVLEVLKMKSNMTDDEFYEYLGGENHD